MTDTVSSLAQQLRSYWLRDIGASGGAASIGGGGAMIAHALSGPYHTGELAQAQAPWAVTDDELTAHAADPDAHHAHATAGTGISISGQQVSLSNGSAQYQVPVTGATPFTPAYTGLGTFAGAGMSFTGGQYAVGAGTLVTVGSTTVSLSNGSAQYQVPVTGATPFTPAYTGLGTFAGAGMSFTGGQYAVGQGAGLTVSASTVALTTPGTLSVDSLNAAAGNHTHTIDYSSDPNATASILATTSAGLLTLRNGAFRQAAQSQAVFASGFAGSGWRVDYGVTTASKASAEFDDLTVRGRMRVYELLIQQIRATNGSVFVSSASKVVSVTTNANPAWTVNGVQLTFNGSNATFAATLYTISTAAAGDTGRELYHGFLPGDLIRAQQVNWNGSSYDFVMQSNLEVTGVTDLFTYQAARSSGNAPAVGYDYVRLGNSSDTTRQGAIYLTSDDSAAPFIDIVDGVRAFSDWNSAGVARVRVGNLTGISDTAFGGPLAGYGLYGNNVYLKGQMIVTGGSLGGLAAVDVNQNTTTIDGGKITANSVTANQIAANTITTSLLNFTPVLTGNVVASINATAEGLKIAANLIQIDGTTVFSAGYDPTTRIASGGAAADVNANVTTISGGKITTNSITADKINVTDLSALGATIGGWAIASGSLTSSNIGLYSGATGAARLETGSGSNLAGVLSGGASGSIAFWAGSGFAGVVTAPYRVTLGGALTATNADVTGAIKATSGYIGGSAGGWAIASNQITSTGIGLYAGAAGAARLQVSTGSYGAGIIAPTASNDTVIWAGTDYASRSSANFGVWADGTMHSTGAALLNADINTVTITNATITSMYAGAGPNVRLATDGQRFLLPNVTSVDVPTSSSALRWFSSLGGTFTAAQNYTGLVGYRHTTYNTVDMLYTAFVGSTDYATYAARFILQAGHSDGTTYTDTRLEVVREAGSGAKYIGVYADRMEMNGSVRLMTLAATPAIGGSAESAHIYCKGNKFVIAYNNSGTIRYKTLTLNTTATTWQDSVTEP